MSEGWLWVEDWLPYASCGGQYRSGEPAPETCAACPVRSECLEHALASPWRPYGVWAGVGENELYPLWQARHPNRGSQDEIFELIGLYRDDRGKEPGKEQRAS